MVAGITITPTQPHVICSHLFNLLTDALSDQRPELITEHCKLHSHARRNDPLRQRYDQRSARRTPRSPAPGVRGLAAKQIARETAQLEAAGANVRLVTFDEAAQAAGQNLMDASAIPAVAEAARAHARRIAPKLNAWWQV